MGDCGALYNKAGKSTTLCFPRHPPCSRPSGACSSHHLRRRGGPCRSQDPLQPGDATGGERASPGLEDGRHCVVHFEIWAGRWPKVLYPKSWEMEAAPVCTTFDVGDEAQRSVAPCHTQKCAKVALDPLKWTSWSTLMPSAMKIKDVFFPSVMTPASTLPEDGFCLQNAALSLMEMLLLLEPRIRSFCLNLQEHFV